VAKKLASWSNTYLTKFLDTDKDDARTDIRNLLTQRAIQSFMRLLEECRDPHSAKCKFARELHHINHPLLSSCLIHPPSHFTTYSQGSNKISSKPEIF
jgi:hypothetical protein